MISTGRATIQLGAEPGVVVAVQAGEVVLIPAGVAHQSLDPSPDVCAVGAYRVGQPWDTGTGKPGKRPRTGVDIARVPLPQADPVVGPNGALMPHGLTVTR